MPQWAVIGLPGQAGQTSPAAWSHTVKIKSITGAPERANSSQLLLRNPCVGSWWLFEHLESQWIHYATGALPALYPLKRPLPQCSISASARMLLAELPVQRNKAL